ncbi:MAG: hypothetical protein JWL75_598 [Parcubacteria group bacterium]|nr:hypothetical protein [Parcubacteria group bacterium]
MDIEDLSKAQLLLLTVMVNFVVSIATGILTVSLLDKVPIQVSQGVDRIVEHTIQTIATPIQVVNPIKSITSPAAPAAPDTEQLMTTAVGNDAARTVLIYRDSTSTPAIAFGTYLPKSRAVVTVTTAGGLPKEAVIAFSDGSALKASISKSTGTLSIYGFADEASLPVVPDAVLVASSKLKQGQTVLALTKDSAALTGIISKVSATSIDTTISGVPVGGGVVDLSGHVIGISGNATTGLIIPADAIIALLQAPTPK